MKTAQLVLALAGASLAASSFAVPTSAPVRSAAPQPVPSSIVAPTNLPRTLAGSTINVEFKLDANGRPRDVRLPSVYDPQAARQLTEAIRQWQFTPAPADKNARETRFVLPLEIKA